MRILHDKCFIAIVALTLAGCNHRQSDPAPITDGFTKNTYKGKVQNTRTVLAQSGDTVAKLAKNYQVKSQDIIVMNHLRPPYELTVGQHILLPNKPVFKQKNALAVRKNVPKTSRFASLPPQPGQITLLPADRSTEKIESLDPKHTLPADNQGSAPVVLGTQIFKNSPLEIPSKNTSRSENKAVEKDLDVSKEACELPVETRLQALKSEPPIQENIKTLSVKKFAWPLQGRILQTFGKTDSGFQSDGIDIEGKEGQPILSIADGVVAYVGNELHGFGNLILIKHKDGWISAYAHCSSFLVKKDDKVKQSTPIAKVGRTGNTQKPKLHFELRQKTKAVDPVQYLE